MTSAPPSPTDQARAQAAEGTGGAELVRARADAMLPADLLQPDETIILLLKPSPWFILLDSLRTLVILSVSLAGLLALSSVYPLRLNQHDLTLLTVAVGGVRLFWQFLEWMGRVYVLTDRRVIRVMGVVRIQIFEAGLTKIQNTNTLFSLRERLFGLGTIGFATAGTAGMDAYWRMVAHPLEVHQTVVRAINRYR